MQKNSVKCEKYTLDQKIDIIETILKWPKGHKNRAKMYKRVSQSLKDDIFKKSVSTHTLRRWVSTYENHGAAKMIRSQRYDAGESRVKLSRKFDHLMSQYDVDLSAKEQIVCAVTQHMITQWQIKNITWIKVLESTESFLRNVCQQQCNIIVAEKLLNRRTVENYRNYSKS